MSGSKQIMVYTKTFRLVENVPSWPYIMALSIPRSLGLKLEDETVVACDSETLIRSCVSSSWAYINVTVHRTVLPVSAFAWLLPHGATGKGG